MISFHCYLAGEVNYRGWHSAFYTAEPLHSVLGDQQHGIGDDVTEKKLGQEASTI